VPFLFSFGKRDQISEKQSISGFVLFSYQEIEQEYTPHWARLLDCIDPLNRHLAGEGLRRSLALVQLQ